MTLTRLLAAVIGVALSGAVFPLYEIKAEQCASWDVSSLSLTQDVYHVKLELQRQGSNITGRAFATGGGFETDTDANLGNKKLGINGPFDVDGSIDSNTLRFTIFWDGRSVGVYEGVIGPTGRVEGSTYDKFSPGSKGKWFSANRLNCLDAASAAPAPPQKSKKLGKKKPERFDPNSAGAAIEGSSVSGQIKCKPGYVWRVARPEDRVCVTPDSRTRVARESQNPEGRWDANGAYGPNTCVAGLVWREAFEGDTICVTPQIRAIVKRENELADSRRVGG